MASSTGTDPALSILMPIYNTETYLPQALDSLLSQTFRDFEVVCINDGSTDGSRNIVQAYMSRDPRVRIIDKPNSGYGASLNRGIREASGAYIGILEPDDFLEPDALEALVHAAQSTDSDVAKANYWFYWSKPEERNREIKVVTSEFAAAPFNAKEHPAILHSIPSIWSGVYRRDLLLQPDVSFSETPGASFQDMGFSFKVFASANRICCIEKPVLHYRQDNESSSVNNPNKVFCVCDEFKGIYAFIGKDPARAWMGPYAYRLQYDSYIWNFERLAPELRSAFLPRMKDDLQRGYDTGLFRPELFGSWQQKNLQCVLRDSQRFLNDYPVQASRLSKARYYLKLGGPKVLLDALKR